MPAANERFHASGGVRPLTVVWEFGSASPARTFVEAATSQSRRSVVRQPPKALSKRQPDNVVEAETDLKREYSPTMKWKAVCKTINR
jgi:hypothetical protein